MRAGSAQSTVGTLIDLTNVTVPFTTDSDPATWERVEGTRTLPASTVFLEVQLSSQVSQMPADGVFFDFVNTIVDPSGLIWDLSAINSTILTDAAIFEDEGEPLQDDSTMFDYFLTSQSALFDTWQAQLKITNPELVIDQWLESNHPSIFAGMLKDFASLPALSSAGIIALVVSMTAGGWFAARSSHRRRSKRHERE
jgi:hypothetical protein